MKHKSRYKPGDVVKFRCIPAGIVKGIVIGDWRYDAVFKWDRVLVWVLMPSGSWITWDIMPKYLTFVK